MTIVLDRDQGLLLGGDEQFALECPYCSVYAHMSPQSVPRAAAILEDHPKHVGLVVQCDACKAPVFLRFAVKAFDANRVELNRNFIELERPKERFDFTYLPKETEVLFREALACYSGSNFNAFASMCRRSAASAFAALGESGKLQAFDEVVIAQDIAGIDDDTFGPIKAILFDVDEEEKLPLLNRAQAGILLEIMKDLFYQLFVRRGKLTRAIKVRRFFVQEASGDLASSA
jgi:hypothetical protein